MKKMLVIAAASAVALLSAACTLTNEQKQAVTTAAPIVVSLASAFAPAQIVDQMKKGCADLMSNQQLVDLAVAKATQALKDTSGVVTTASNAASIGCSLLVPPPAAASSG